MAYQEDIIRILKQDISNNFPFLESMTKHLLFSHDQGLKLQICEFLKALMEHAEQKNVANFKD